ncbi:unnamed protein product [Ranitomeya imitator]|uniref:Uncharacterized protein n=1 Tax=Ranitomeya imitator TaxID=111125 RepID=A0ABN9LVY9_9NEOB|nr:unnamed protein product [Ranitomeya imitator]
MAFPRNNLMHLNHTANPTPNSNFMDLSHPSQHNTGLGGIPISDHSNSVESINVKEWQDGLRALLPNININFGGLQNASSPSNATHSAPTSNHATPNSLNWDCPSSWMDPAIITGRLLLQAQLSLPHTTDGEGDKHCDDDEAADQRDDERKAKTFIWSQRDGCEQKMRNAGGM